MKPRFTFGPSVADELLTHADSIKIDVHRVGSTLALSFEVKGGLGSISNFHDPDQARQVRDFAESLLSAFGPRLQPDDDDEDDCFC